MKCPKCQHLNDSAAKVCAGCASPLARACASCGNPLPLTAKFCPECAHPTGLATTTQPPFLSPNAYTPTHLAAKILNSRAAIEGERKQVTVLFADLKGSTELLADRDPEEARNLLEPILKLMMEAVHHYEGTVNQAAGDGIMALFGAPVAHEDHAVRACYAALRMQEQVKRHAEGSLHTFGVNLQIRVGLNSGEVVVGTIGSDLRMDYTAVGRTTHLAGRMEQLASPGSILLTPATLDLVQGLVTARSLGPVPVKGLADPLEVHELTGVGPAQTRFQAVARRRLTRFVGRDAELEHLRRMQSRSHEGQGQVVSIVAEPGVGKSRLVYEFRQSHISDNWRVLECTAVSYGKAMSYLPLSTLLKTYFGITDQDGPRQIRDTVAKQLLALNLYKNNIVIRGKDSVQAASDESKLLILDRALQPMLPALLAVLDVPVEDTSWTLLEPPERRRRMLDAVRRLLLRHALDQPLLLIFEDLHWIDGETQALIDGLVESLKSARILLLATCRPEYKHQWASRAYYSQVRLDTLSAESAGGLLDALLGNDPTLLPVKQLLVKGGNPFVLEESVRTLVETKALEGLPGRYRLTRPVEAIQVPATVRAMLAARIDRLLPEDKHLLQIAAVIGQSAPVSLLGAVADLPVEAVRDGLRRLQAAEFVYFTGLLPIANFLHETPDFEYTFKHALTQEVAYGAMLQERRSDVHARVASAMETLYRDSLNVHFERLAYHAEAGKLHEKAASYLFRAGRKASRQAASHRAVILYEHALALLEELQESQTTIELNVDIRNHLTGVLIHFGQARKAMHRLQEVEALAGALKDEGRRARFWSSMAGLKCLLGEFDEALSNTNRANAIAERIGDSALSITCRNRLQQIHHYRGEYHRVVELASAILAENLDDASFRYSTSYRGSTHTHHWLAWSLIELGRFGQAANHVHHLFMLADPAHTRAKGLARLIEAGRLVAMGDWSLARPMAEKAIESLRGSSGLLPLAHAMASSAWILAHIGHAKKALARVQESEELLKRQLADGAVVSYGKDYVTLAKAALQLGRNDDAWRLAHCCLNLSSAQPGPTAHAQQLLGDLASQSNGFDAERAEVAYSKALALAEPRSMKPVIAHCHFGLSKLYHRISKSRQAREHLTVATSMYRDMDMRFYLEQAEAQE